METNEELSDSLDAIKPGLKKLEDQKQTIIDRYDLPVDKKTMDRKDLDLFKYYFGIVVTAFADGVAKRVAPSAGSYRQCMKAFDDKGLLVTSVDEMLQLKRTAMVFLHEEKEKNTEMHELLTYALEDGTDYVLETIRAVESRSDFV